MLSFEDYSFNANSEPKKNTTKIRKLLSGTLQHQILMIVCRIWLKKWHGVGQ